MALSHQQYTIMLSQKLQSWRRHKARRLPEAWHEAALVLLRLDLDPARPLLRTLYASGHRGRPPTTRSVSCGPSSSCCSSTIKVSLSGRTTCAPIRAWPRSPASRLSRPRRSAPSTPLLTGSKTVPLRPHAPTVSAPAVCVRGAIGATSSKNKRIGTRRRPAIPRRPIRSPSAWPRSYWRRLTSPGPRSRSPRSVEIIGRRYCIDFP
jgi:hypothetical protein